MKGLSSEQALEQQKRHGKNQLEKKEKFKTVKIAISQFLDPLVILLLIAASGSYILGETMDATLIGIIIVVNGVFGFFQEYGAEKTIEKIQEKIKSQVKVRRDGKVVELDATELVPKDIILLEAGDKVPADCRIISGSLSVDESTLTGESIPVQKENEEIYAGTLIVKGKAEAEVLEIGMNTKLGRISELTQEETQTPFQEKLHELSILLGKVVIGISTIVALVGILEGKSFLKMIELGVSLGVAAVPEGLIILSTMCLAIGVKRMAQHKAIVKKLPGVEALGSVDVLCVDKTGTITENKLKVKEVWGDVEAIKIAASLTSQELKDPLDEAIRKWAGTKHPESFEPFDSDKKFAMASLKSRLYVKGAPEIIAKLCKKIPKGFDAEIEKMAKNGLKVIAVASGLSEGKMELHGLIGMQDPPRKGVEKVIQQAKEMGIEIVMITGDHPTTARAIAESAGITGKVVDLEKENFDGRVEDVGVFARVNPEDKLRIVEAIQKSSLTVGMTGDGVNDAPALKKANIGIALGSGTEIAKESADIVLLDDNLETIVHAVEEGRNVFLNVKKATQYLLGMNIAEVVAVALGIFFGSVILKPVQILWLNLITDAVPALAFAYDRNPISDKNQKIIDNEVWKSTLIVGSLLGLATLGGFLAWGSAAALNILIYTELGYQPIVRNKFKSKGWVIPTTLLTITLGVQLLAGVFFSQYLGFGLPGKELLVVGGLLAVFTRL